MGSSNSLFTTFFIVSHLLGFGGKPAGLLGGTKQEEGAVTPKRPETEIFFFFFPRASGGSRWWKEWNTSNVAVLFGERRTKSYKLMWHYKWVIQPRSTRFADLLLEYRADSETKSLAFHAKKHERFGSRKVKVQVINISLQNHQIWQFILTFATFLLPKQTEMWHESGCNMLIWKSTINLNINIEKQ